MNVKLLYVTPNLVNPTYTLEVDGITTKTLMSLSRHHTIQLTVQSSRYTMKKNFRSTTNKADLVTLSTDIAVRELQLKQINEIAVLISKNPDITQDELNLLLPQGYKYNLVMTLNKEALSHFYSLRNLDSQAHRDMKELAERVRKAIDFTLVLTATTNFTPLSVVARAISKCYSIEHRLDDGGEKDIALIKKVAGTYKHMSVLRHCTVILPDGSGKYSYYTETKSGERRTVFNLQELLEMCKASPNMITRVLPKEYSFLLQ